MKCPNDNTELIMSEREGVEIDYCPECRGVWLDKGELDKVIERSNAQYAYAGHDDRSTKDYQQGNDGQKKKKKGGLIGDIFGGLGG